MSETTPGTCRFCGCTETNACVGKEGACYWCDDRRTVCSACLSRGATEAIAGNLEPHQRALLDALAHEPLGEDVELEDEGEYEPAKPKKEPGRYNALLKTGRAARYRHEKYRDAARKVVAHGHFLDVQYASGRIVRWQYRDKPHALKAKRSLEMQLSKALNDTQYDALIDRYDRLVQEAGRAAEQMDADARAREAVNEMDGRAIADALTQTDVAASHEEGETAP